MALPDNVDQYETTMGRVKLEVHTQPNGSKNYWLFSSVAAIELREEDVGELGKLLVSYDAEKIDRNKLWQKWFTRLLFPPVFIYIGYMIGVS